MQLNSYFLIVDSFRLVFAKFIYHNLGHPLFTGIIRHHLSKKWYLVKIILQRYVLVIVLVLTLNAFWILPRIFIAPKEFILAGSLERYLKTDIKIV